MAFIDHSSVINEVKDAYESTGAVVQDIADRYGVHYATIHRWARMYGWFRRGYGSRIVGEQLDSLRHTYETDFTMDLRTVADHFGISPDTVRVYARRHGWKKRHNSQYERTKTHKLCTVCSEWLPKKDFRNGGTCNLCIRARKYNTTRKYLTNMLEKQGGRCAICRHKFGKWCVDHDHSTGVIRGLLCDKCNTALGLLQDSPGIVTRAAEYLGYYSNISKSRLSVE